MPVNRFWIHRTKVTTICSKLKQASTARLRFLSVDCKFLNVYFTFGATAFFFKIYTEIIVRDLNHINVTL